MTPPPATCATCTAPLAADQRYCLHCGTRHGAPRVDPLGALGFGAEAGEGVAPTTASGAAVPAGSGSGDGAVPAGSGATTGGAGAFAGSGAASDGDFAAGGPAAGGARRRWPVGIRATVALGAAMLVVGGVAGAAIGPAPAPTLAAAPGRVVALVVPSPAPVATTPTATVDPEPPAIDDEPAAPSADDDDTPATPSTDDDTTTNNSPDTTAPAPTSTADDDAPTPAPTPAPASSTTPSTPTTPAAPTAHVWVISLTQLDATTAFGPASPLADLTAQGTLLAGYTPVAASAAANEIALLGGQVPTADCAADLAACVVPATDDDSLPDQLRSAKLAWRAYVEDAATRCAAAPTDRVAPSLFATLATRPDCSTNVVGLDALTTDLTAKPAKVAPFNLVVPGVCHDGRATPCAAGAPAGLEGASPTVHDLVAQITASAAYQADGVLILVPDAPPPSTDPAAPLPPTGALVLSPRATAGQTIATPTGPVALLRSLDELLGQDPLGAAAQAPAGALDGVLAPAVASASTFPHRSPSPPPTRRSS
ncbi:MAG TPA: hypothetical protein VGM33_20750 [Baekduia sp.]|jgi:hypothetical protein